MRTMILLAALVCGTAAQASTDYTCVSDCTAQGNMYGLCVSKCSYDAVPQQPRQTDYSCVSNCTAQGYIYGMCVQRCSY